MKRFLVLVLMLSAMGGIFCVHLTSDDWQSNTQKQETTGVNLKLSLGDLQYYEFGFTNDRTVGDAVTPIDGIEFEPEIENVADGGVRIFADDITNINIYWKATGRTSFRLRLKASGPLTWEPGEGDTGNGYMIGWNIAWDEHSLGYKNGNIYSNEDDSSIVMSRNLTEHPVTETGLQPLTISVEPIKIGDGASFPPLERYVATITLIAEAT